MRPRLSFTLLLSFICVLLQLAFQCTIGFSIDSSTTRKTGRRPSIGFSNPNIPSRPLSYLSRVPSTTTTTRSIITVTSTTLGGSAVPVQKAVKRGAAVPNSFIKGRLTAFLSKFLITPTMAWHIGRRLLITLKKDIEEITTIVIVYKFAIQIARKIHHWQHRHIQDDDTLDRLFRRSKTLRIARALKEVAQLCGLIIALEFGLVLLEELKFEFVRIYPVYQWTCSVIAAVWGASNLSEFKDFILSKGGKININNSAGRSLLSQFLDVCIYGTVSLLLLDFLDVQTGYVLKSLFGLSSVGTLVFSLASKELVGEFLAGLAIQGTNMYTGKYAIALDSRLHYIQGLTTSIAVFMVHPEGEKILLQDGTAGTVQKLGWLNTHLRQSDELVVRIPNTQISGKRVANVSRSRLSSVKQALAISCDDVDKLPKLTNDIKTEIRRSCPTLVDDGSRGFSVFFTDYKDKSVTVAVSAYFRTRPFTEEYQVVKQEVVLAIERATKKRNINYSFVNWQLSGIPID